MDELNKISEELTKHVDMRITYLPPSTVAASHYIGENPEHAAGQNLNDFITKSQLYKIKPDLRVYGFNNPNPDKTGSHGYEYWVTIPEDMEVPGPLEKKKFDGGLYAGHCIRMGDFDEWQYVYKWIGSNGVYVYDAREPMGMDGCIEEHLNAYTHYKENKRWEQLDLLIPIKEKSDNRYN